MTQKHKKQKRDVKRQKIEALCRQMLRGDFKATKELKNKKLKDPTISKLVENYMTENNGMNVIREQRVIPSFVRVSRTPFTFGSSFKPYQGGLPSLGKKR